MGAIRWGTRGMRPSTFSDSGDIICHVPPHFLFRCRNILVSHQPAPPLFYNKIAPMHGMLHELWEWTEMLQLKEMAENTKSYLNFIQKIRL